MSPTQHASYLRAGVWLLHIGLPLFGLWILLARPEVDAHLQHNPTHFWLVAGLALINVAMANRISAEAARRRDARLFIVSLAFLVSAAFIGLHALATPQVLLASGNIGFTPASPIGLRHVAELEPLGEVSMKGRSEAVQAYRLLGLRE